MPLASVEFSFDPAAPDYAPVHRLAARLLRRERRGHTLQPTALIHEAWLRLRRLPRPAFPVGAWTAVFARAMQRVLVDHARRRRARCAATEIASARFEPARSERLLDIESALHELAAHAPRLAQVVELRFFAGLPVAAVAASLGVTERTIVRDWAEARVRLRGLLDEGEDHGRS